MKKYELPKLSYGYDALEPYIDAMTMEIHHTKHHQAYINNLNVMLEANPDLAGADLEDMMRSFSNLHISEADKTKLKNNGGGHLNHSLFWDIMNPSHKKDGHLVKEITETFGSVDEFKKQFTQTAMGHFGSGWTWLVRDEVSDLQIYSLPNQDSPYLKNHTPVLGLDVWEHAYYLKYQNRRAEYIENWWKVIKMLG